MAIDLQAEYNQAPTNQPSPDTQSQAQDLTIPGAVVPQLAQAIQSQDCATIMKLLSQVISGGGGDTDNDGM